MERGKLLDECAARLGTSWARSLSDAMLLEQRAVAGGFPGTVPEARWRVARYLGAELERLALSPLRPNEASVVVDVTYARARREWSLLARSEKGALEARTKNECSPGQSGATVLPSSRNNDQQHR